MATYSEEVKAKWAFQGAATYLDRTEPERYDRDLVLTSILTLIGSAAEQDDKEVSTLLLNYISSHADSIFSRLSGKELANPTSQETPLGIITDLTSRGCFEVLHSPKDMPDQFTLRFQVKTAHAKAGRRCLG
jgi:hypothetical protein